MFKDFLEAFEKLTLLKISSKGIIFILVSFILFLIVFPSIYNHFTYSGLQKKVNLLDSINKIDRSKLSKDQRLVEQYNLILRSIKEDTMPVFNSSSIVIQSTATITMWKFLSGIFWPFFFLSKIFLQIPKDPRSLNVKFYDYLAAIILYLFVGIFLGFIGTLIPTFKFPLINYLGYPVIQFIIYWNYHQIPRES